jgi:hypothetical protein
MLTRWSCIIMSRTSAVPAARVTMAAATLVPWSNARRAATWFAAKAAETAHRMTTPVPGESFVCMGPEVIACRA